MAKSKKRKDSSGSHTLLQEGDSSSGTAVKINVGGTLYEVSRSLLEQYPNTMICRMASESWHENQEQTLFIERDGQRFRYVLDFMRDGKVSVPGGQAQGGITKSSLLDELTYFGFQCVSPHSVQVEFVGFDAPKYMARLTEDFEKEQQKLKERRDQLNVEIASAAVAHACAIRMMATGCASVEFNFQEVDTSGYNEPKPPKTYDHLDVQAVKAVQETSLDYHESALNTALEKYGLRVSNYQEHMGGSYHSSKRKIQRMTMQIHSVSD